MLDKSLFTYILGKCNSENTQDITFKGNYVFVRINDTQTLLDASSYNAYDLKAARYVAMAEATSQPTPFVEANNRIGWIKRYVFQFDLRNKDEVLTALQEIYQYFRDTNTHTITDGSDTLKYVVKVSPPAFVSNQQQAGGISVLYFMDFMGETVETGYYGNEVSHYFNVSTDTVSAGSFVVGNAYYIQTVGTTDFTAIGATSNSTGVAFIATGVGSGSGNATELDSITVDYAKISSSVTLDPSNDLQGSENTSNVPTARAVDFDMAIYYDSGTAVERLLGHIEGKLSRTDQFCYARYFDGVWRSWNLYYSGGSVVYQKGVIIQVKAQFGEV